MTRRLYDLTGLRTGALLVLSPDPNNHENWLVRCDCGREASHRTFALRTGRTVTCGLICPIRSKNCKASPRTHGGSHSPEWRSWEAMIQRCTNPKRQNYDRYGGRGIRVCDRWLKFQAFIDDMGKRPTLQYTLDRIDVNGNYEPSNCRWATLSEQARNTRVVKLRPHHPAQIRWLASIGCSQREIAELFKVSQSNVRSVIKGQSWR